MKKILSRPAFIIIFLLLLSGNNGVVNAADQKITVLSPLGKPPPIKEIVAWFNRNMPGVHAVYRRKAGGFTAEDPALWAEIKAKGDAMIMGMGH